MNAAKRLRFRLIYLRRWTLDLLWTHKPTLDVDLGYQNADGLN